MKRMKRITAFLLAAFLIFTTGYYEVPAAAFNQPTAAANTEQTTEMKAAEETTETKGTEGTTEVKGTEETAEVKGTEEATETKSTEEATEVKGTEETTEVKGTEETTEETTEALPKEDTEEIAVETDALVSNFIVTSPRVATPGTQHAMMMIGDDKTKIASAVLTYQNKATKETYDVSASYIKDNFVAFQMEFQDESWSGTYVFKHITYTENDITTTTSFKDMGIDAAFGVNQDVDTAPDDVLLTDEQLAALSEDVSMNVVSLDENGSTTSETDVEAAISNASEETGVSELTRGASRASKGVDATGMKSLVVVLDPGHGGSDSGAVGNNIQEKAVNLKIAQYCKEELEKYTGITVYMTRTGDSYVALADRVNFAVSKGADVFVSLHNNSNTSSAPNGANVYYPNSNYNAAAGATGAALAKIIEDYLTSLGLASGGIHIRNTENNSKYPDGSLSDYYAVIRESKMNGIPGIIVEHAFISNASDAANYLSTNEKLKKLGVADATGIAQYYGLTQGLGFASVESKSSTSIELGWKAQSGVTGYEIQRSTSNASGFATVATITNASATSWTDTGLTSGSTFYYRIRSYTTKSGKTSYSNWSAVVSGITMQQPVIAAVRSENNKKIKLTWNQTENAKNIEIYRSTEENGTYGLLATVNGINNYTYNDSSVSEGKLYYYKIRSIGMIDNTTIYSDYSAPLSGRSAVKPKSLYAVSRNSNSIRISWKGSSNVTGYTVMRSTSKSGTYKKIATVKDPKAAYFDDTTVSAGKTYYYKVEAYNYNGSTKGYSGRSSAFMGKTVKKADITKIESQSSSKLKLTWKKVSGANGYVLYRSTSKNGTYKKIKTISSGSTTSYTNSNLSSGKTYYYKIKARNKVNGKTGYGTYSTVRSTGVIKRASITSVTGAGATKITVSWKKVDGSSGYNIYRSTSEKGTYKKIGSASKNVTSYSDSKLKMTQKYYYKVEAKASGYKKSGSSGLSKAVGGYPTRKTSFISATSSEEGQLVLNWNRVTKSSGYEIYRSTAKDGTFKLIKKIDNNTIVTYADTSASSGTSYFYKIRVVSKYDGKKIYGSYSSVIEGKILPAPVNVTVTSISASQLDIAWSPAEGADGYEIYRSTDPNGTYSIIGAIGSGTTVNYSDTTVTEGVTYYYKIKAVDISKHSSAFSSAASGCAVAKISIQNLSWNPSKTSVSMTWTDMPGDKTGYELYRISSANVTEQVKVAATKSNSFTDTSVSSAANYYYRVRIYNTAGGKTTYGIFSNTASTNPTDYRIMGSSSVTAASMAKMYKASGKAYPASVYSSKGAPDIETFCNIVYEECEAEGMRAEVIFAQICHETNYLQFGGQVQAYQCNFGGLGAVDSGGGGGVFADVRTGIRTQVQHMKAYASTDELKQVLIDGRFAYIARTQEERDKQLARGKAEFVQQLGSGNWATDTAYAVKLMNYINKIKNA